MNTYKGKIERIGFVEALKRILSRSGESKQPVITRANDCSAYDALSDVACTLTINSWSMINSCEGIMILSTLFKVSGLLRRFGQKISDSLLADIEMSKSFTKDFKAPMDAGGSVQTNVTRIECSVHFTFK